MWRPSRPRGYRFEYRTGGQTINDSSFKIRVPQFQLDDLKRRLTETRWPTPLAGVGWDDGADFGLVQRLIAHWREGFDWRAQEARLNGLPQFTALVDGLTIHFVHQRGVGPSPMPLVLTHGWPGSFTEMEHILPLLTDPGAHGGDPADAFHVVVPSLPGYGFSSAPTEPGMNTRAIAGLWRTLMQGLGYARFAAQGGDIGAGVSLWLARRFPEAVIGAHVNFIPGSYRPWLGPGAPPPTPDEQTFLDRISGWAATEGAYSHLQSTKPLTLAYSLTDSPTGLAAWIVEKFQAWTDCDGDVERVFSLDTLLTDISLYWFGNTLNGSLRLYKENRLNPFAFAAGERVEPPIGVALFPRELPMPPRSWVERVFDVRRWTTMPKGGHFAALEQPELLAEDIRTFFRPLRTRGEPEKYAALPDDK